MVIFWLLFGLACGLLVNYLADVLPRTRRLSKPFWCPGGEKTVGKYLSSPRVALVLLFYIAASFYVWQNPPFSFPAYLLFSILIYFGLVAVIDIEHRIVMHPVSIVGALALGAIGVWRHGWTTTLLGAAAGFSLMLALYFAGDLLGRGLARLRSEPWQETALGFGDVNLAAVIGLLMGYPGVLAALVAGLLAAGVFSFGYLLWMAINRKYRAFAAIPYAPFLCLGTVIMVAISIY